MARCLCATHGDSRGFGSMCCGPTTAHLIDSQAHPEQHDDRAIQLASRLLLCRWTRTGSQRELHHAAGSSQGRGRLPHCRRRKMCAHCCCCWLLLAAPCLLFRKPNAPASARLTNCVWRFRDGCRAPWLPVEKVHTNDAWIRQIFGLLQRSALRLLVSRQGRCELRRGLEYGPQQQHRGAHQRCYRHEWDILDPSLH